MAEALSSSWVPGLLAGGSVAEACMCHHPELMKVKSRVLGNIIAVDRCVNTASHLR